MIIDPASLCGVAEVPRQRAILETAGAGPDPAIIQGIDSGIGGVRD